jgi:sugar phosphate permease
LKKNRGIQIGVLLVAWMAFLFSFVDRLSWSSMMPIASKALAMNLVQAGSFSTAFYIGYVITQLPGGLLTDRFGYRKVLLGSFLVMGVFTGLMGTIHSYGQGYLFRILAGAGSGAVFSACVRALFDWFSGAGRTTAMGFFMTASSLGVTVVNWFVPHIAETQSWRMAFYVAGLLPLVGFVVGLLLLREPQQALPLEKRPVQSGRAFWRDVALLTRNRNLMITGLAGFCAMWATWGTQTWVNTYINKALHVSVTQAGFYSSLMGMAALFCKPLIGALSDLTGARRKTMLFWTLIFFGPVLLWFGANRSLSLLIALAPIVGIVSFIYSPIMNTFIGELVEERLVGTATGLVNTIWQLGSMLSPLVVGNVLQSTHSYLNAFATLAAGPIVAALLVLLVREKQDKQQLSTKG